MTACPPPIVHFEPPLRFAPPLTVFLSKRDTFSSQSKVRFALIFLFAASGNHIQSPLQAVCQNIAKAHFRLLTDCIFDDLEKQESVVSFGG